MGKAIKIQYVVLLISVITVIIDAILARYSVGRDPAVSIILGFAAGAGGFVGWSVYHRISRNHDVLNVFAFSSIIMLKVTSSQANRQLGMEVAGHVVLILLFSIFLGIVIPLVSRKKQRI